MLKLYYKFNFATEPNKSLIDDNTIDYLKTILNKKTTKESTKFDEKSTNKTESLNNQYSSYIDKYIEHLESEIRQKNRQILLGEMIKFYI